MKEISIHLKFVNYTGHALGIIYLGKAMVFAFLKMGKFWEDKNSFIWVFSKRRHFHKYKDIIVIELAFNLLIRGKR